MSVVAIVISVVAVLGIGIGAIAIYRNNQKSIENDVTKFKNIKANL